MFKSVLRTFEAEILKIFKNIQSRPKKLDVLIKKKEYTSSPHINFKGFLAFANGPFYSHRVTRRQKI